MKGKKQVEAQFGQQSKFVLRRLHEFGSFELCESDDDEDWQVQDAQETVQQDAATPTDIPGQNCKTIYRFTAKISSSNSNSQPNCSNGSPNFGLTANSSQTSTALVGAHVDPTVVHFVLDSGCTQHIFNGSRDNFTNFASKTQRICTANDKGGLSAGGVGDLPVTFTGEEDDEELPVTLRNVLWAPTAISSLLSVSQAVKGGCTHGIDAEGAYLQLPAPGEEYVWADERQGLYIVPAKLQLASPAVISLSASTSSKSANTPSKDEVMRLAMQIHASLGHFHWAGVKSLLKAGAISQVSKMSSSMKEALLSLSSLPCTHCDLSKKTLRSLPHAPPSSTKPSKRPWQLVLADH